MVSFPFSPARDCENALSDFEKAIELGAELAPSDRAKLLVYLGRDDEVLAAVGEGINVEGQSAEYYEGFVYPLFWLGRVEEALELLDRTIELHPDDTTAYYLRAAISCFGNRPCDEIMADLKRGERTGGGPATGRLWMHTSITGLRCDAGSTSDLRAPCPDDYDIEGTLQIARMGLEVQPENSNLKGLLGLALYRSGRFEEAREALIGFLENRPESLSAYGVILFTMAMTEWQLGDAAEAFVQDERGVRSTEV